KFSMLGLTPMLFFIQFSLRTRFKELVRVRTGAFAPPPSAARQVWYKRHKSPFALKDKAGFRLKTGPTRRCMPRRQVTTIKLKPTPGRGGSQWEATRRRQLRPEAGSATTFAIRGSSKRAISSGVGAWKIANHRDSASRSMGGLSKSRR